MTGEQTILRMSNVHKRFGGVVALDGVDFEVRSGEVHALLGENGAGKSTLMKVLSGAHQADRGEIELAGKRFAPRRPVDALRAGIAMIYQDLTLAEHLTVEQNIMLGREERVGSSIGFIVRRRSTDSVRDAMLRLGRPDITPNTIVGKLGAADRQIVEIARSLVARARVVVLDEPTSSLGRNEVTNLFDVVRRLREEGVAVIYISHVLEEIRTLCDRFTVLRDGGTVGSGEVSTTPNARLIKMMVGREVNELYPTSNRVAGEPILNLDALCGRRLPREASLDLHRGEIFGIGGLVGSGRSELLRALFGLDPIVSGRVRVALASGSELREDTRATAAKRLRQGIGFLSEDRKNEGLALRLPVAINATLSRFVRGRGLARFGAFKRGRLARETIQLCEELSIRVAGPWQPAWSLSGGNQQKVAFARLLHHDCDVLLLDEPTRGVDVGSKAQIYRLLDEAASRGIAIIVICSYIPELLGICDRVAIMHRGHLGPARSAGDWTEHGVLEEALVGSKGGVVS